MKVSTNKSDVLGFTLTELLVVTGTVGVLALMILPVLARDRADSQAGQCFSNFRQLASAWLMYSEDNSGACAGNLWQDEQAWKSHPGENWVAGWIGVAGTGGDGTQGAVGGPDNTNTALLVNPRYSTLGGYTRVPKLYLCPASGTLGSVSFTSPTIYPLCRSVSMNCWMGYNTPVAGDPSQGLGAYFADAANYKVFKKVTDITAGIRPSDAFVFIEERGESIDDGWFAVDGSGLYIINWPADYHNGAGTVGFVDGHVETHLWQNARITSGAQPFLNFLTPPEPSPTSKLGGETESSLFPGSLPWLQQHATCRDN
jgi:prepilin-type processing-associated H-X9-DG protein